MKLYYWKDRANFGDQLSTLLIQRFIKQPVEYAKPKDAEIVMVGSILEQLPISYSGLIVGSGKLHEETKLNLPKASIYALRGPLTAKGIKGNFVLADPGLIADELIKMPEKKYDLGIIPHWTDKTLELNPTFLKYNPKIIRVSDNPLKVIKEIAQCRKVVSSSLHGIVLADAFGIPRRIEVAPKMLTHKKHEGGYFKWQDYSASIGMTFREGVTETANHFKITEKQHELFDVFEEIKTLYKILTKETKTKD